MIDTQAIRNKILDLAMRGQLTEQLPEDGTADELYEQVQTKKQARIKEGKVKKEKPLATIQADEVPFTLPNSWRWVYLGDLFQHNTGKALNASDRQGQLLDYITTSNLYWDRFELNDLKQMPFTESEIEKCTVKKGDLLICEGGDIGRSAIWPFDFNMRIQNHIHRLRRYSSSICTEFYYYLLWFYKQTGRINGIGIGLQGFSSKRVHSLIVPLAPYNEAIRVVDIIKQAFSVLDTIDALQAQYANNLTVLKAKLIDAAIQGKLTEQLPEDGTAEELYQQIQTKKQELIKAGKIKKEKPLPEITADEIPFDIPKNWKWIRWGDVVNIVSARRVHKADWRESGVPFYRAREIAKLAEEGFVQNDLFISEELFSEFSKTGVPQENDLMVTAVGTLGKTYVVNANDRFYYKDASVLCFENFGGINPYYLVFVMKSDMMRKQIESNSGGTTVDTLTMVRMIRYLLPLPPLAEQKRIAQKIDELIPLFEK